MNNQAELIKKALELCLQIKGCNFHLNTSSTTLTVYKWDDTQDFEFRFVAIFEDWVTPGSKNSIEFVIDSLQEEIEKSYTFINAIVQGAVIIFEYGVNGEHNRLIPLYALFLFVNENGYNQKWISEDDYQLIPFDELMKANPGLFKEFFEVDIVPVLKAGL